MGSIKYERVQQPLIIAFEIPERSVNGPLYFAGKPMRRARNRHAKTEAQEVGQLLEPFLAGKFSSYLPRDVSD